jgi:hypothetical protein
MRKRILRIVLAMPLLVSISHTHAKDGDEPKFKMPCKQVLRLGLDKFLDAYFKRTGDYSTAGMKEASWYYMECRRANNHARARRLAEAKRRQIGAVRDELTNLGNACSSLAETRAGGGTMWGLLAAGASASREDFLETLIMILARPSKSQPSARQKIGASLAKVQKSLAGWAKPPDLEEAAGMSAAERRKQYEAFWNQAKQAAARLQNTLRALPDAAAQRVARRMADEIEVLEDETGGDGAQPASSAAQTW